MIAISEDSEVEFQFRVHKKWMYIGVIRMSLNNNSLLVYALQIILYLYIFLIIVGTYYT